MEKNLIPKLTSSLPDVEALRFYLTLPECPLMSDSNNFTTIAIPFGTALVNLEKAIVSLCHFHFERTTAILNNSNNNTLRQRTRTQNRP